MTDTADEKRPTPELTECEHTVEELKQENAQLRNAAVTFGELAERLNAARRRVATHRRTRGTQRPRNSA